MHLFIGMKIVKISICLSKINCFIVQLEELNVYKANEGKFAFRAIE
jgi:hypothetical protein